LNASLKATPVRLVAVLCALAMAAAAVVLTPEASAARADEGATPRRLPLLHLENARGIHLYTLSQAEARGAVANHGFTRRPNNNGDMWTHNDFSSAKAVHRLTKIGGNGWVLITNSQELRDVLATNRFRNEGVVGYVSTKKLSGTVRLNRFSKPGGDWAVSLAAPHGNPQALKDRGYVYDGPLGYVHPN
jgi:hypothetical protein